MAETTKHDRPAAAAAQPGLRFLEAAVYIMGGLLVLMLVIVLGTIAWKATHRTDTPPLIPPNIEIETPLPDAVSHLALDGDRLAIQAGREIIIVDVRRGVIMSRIRLRP